MRHLDLFSGVGGFSLGMEAAGFETAAFSEIEDLPCKVLAHRWPDVPNLGDIREITQEDLDDLGEIDVVTFGSPCQDFSVAGKRLGMQGERSSLFHEAIRVIRSIRGGPRFAIFENVPGLFSSASGWDFAAVLDEMAESGAMDIAWSVLDAQWFGVPQRRRRIFVVADFRGERAGEILSISEGVCRDSAPSTEAGQEAPRSSTPSVASTLGGGSGNRGWCDDTDRMTFVPELSAALAGSTRWDAETETFIPVGFYSNQGYKEDPVEGGSPPLKATQHTTAVATPIPFDTTQITSDKNYSAPKPGDPNHPLAAGAHPPAVAFETRVARNGRGAPSEVVNSLKAEAGQTGKGDAAPCALQGMAVRRLTPLECERLMGWPDGHTDIPGASDSGRYRACGNGVAAPVVEWIAKRMRRVRDGG